MKFLAELFFALIPETSSASVADEGVEIPQNRLPLRVGGCGRGDYEQTRPRPAEPSPGFVLRVLLLSAAAVVVGAVCAVLAVWMQHA